MALPTPSVNAVAGRVGAAARWGNDDVVQAKRELAEARIAEFVRKIVDKAPPLAPEQRARISALLVVAA